jgi:hypothetical protein
VVYANPFLDTILPTEDSRLSLIVTNALMISFDVFKANKAVNTRYIIPIIFCLGDRLFPAISLNPD